MFSESKLKKRDSVLNDSKSSVSSVCSEFLHEANLTYVLFHNLLRTKRICRSPRLCEVVRSVGTFCGEGFFNNFPNPQAARSYFLFVPVGREK